VTKFNVRPLERGELARAHARVDGSGVQHEDLLAFIAS
jgi:hypothetical protein